jgi:hypothetical protein
MEDVGAALVDDGVAGVAAALIPHDDVGVASQNIDDLPFAFVAPLRADDDQITHRSSFPAACNQKKRL